MIPTKEFRGLVRIYERLFKFSPDGYRIPFHAVDRNGFIFTFNADKPIDAVRFLESRWTQDLLIDTELVPGNADAIEAVGGKVGKSPFALGFTVRPRSERIPDWALLSATNWVVMSILEEFTDLCLERVLTFWAEDGIAILAFPENIADLDRPTANFIRNQIRATALNGLRFASNYVAAGVIVADVPAIPAIRSGEDFRLVREGIHAAA